MTPSARLSLVDRADRELSLVAQRRMLKVARSTQPGGGRYPAAVSA
jgi:hypothetical protein